MASRRAVGRRESRYISDRFRGMHDTSACVSRKAHNEKFKLRSSGRVARRAKPFRYVCDAKAAHAGPAAELAPSSSRS